MKNVPDRRILSQREGACLFHCWTRREAFIKALGRGLSIPLNSFDASIPLGTTGRALRATSESPGLTSWWLSDLVMPPGYVGALVIEGAMPRITYHEWN